MGVTLENLGVTPGGEVTCVVRTTRPEYAARLRKAIMMDVPNPAIVDSRIHQNDSSLMTTWELEHRLAMMKVAVDRPLTASAECTCTDPWTCNACSARLVICDENNDPTSTIRSVVASQFVPADDTTPKSVVVHGDTEVTRLANGQSIGLDVLVRTGTGRQNVRFQHITIVSLVPTDSVDETRVYDPKTSSMPSSTTYMMKFSGDSEDDARHALSCAIASLIKNGIQCTVHEKI